MFSFSFFSILFLLLLLVVVIVVDLVVFIVFSFHYDEMVGLAGQVSRLILIGGVYVRGRRREIGICGTGMVDTVRVYVCRK
jgi:preprotein translocase subunit SecY